MEERELIPRMVLEFFVVCLSSKSFDPKIIDLTKKVLDMEEFSCYKFIMQIGTAIECFKQFMVENGDISNEVIISELCDSLKHESTLGRFDTSGFISRSYFDRRIFHKGDD